MANTFPNLPPRMLNLALDGVRQVSEESLRNLDPRERDVLQRELRKRGFIQDPRSFSWVLDPSINKPLTTNNNMAKFKIGDRVCYNGDKNDLGTVPRSRNAHDEWEIEWDDNMGDPDWVDNDDTDVTRVSGPVSTSTATKPVGFKKGDRVRFVDCPGGDDDRPNGGDRLRYGRQYFKKGKVYTVEGLSGANLHVRGLDSGLWGVNKAQWEHADAVKSTSKSGDELAKTELDKLVMDEEKKKEITDILTQHKFQAKIFEEWGLGETIEYGKGMTMMFYGPPGTGKTWGATCIAKALGKEVLSVGPSEIQSSEPGGANRAIEQAFESAGSEGKVLFFDECDSLIADRQSVGMILGSEINTLLTQIEKFEGIVILATNRIGEMDEALERRLALILEFPHPDEKQQKAIWTKLLPQKMPLEKTVTAAFLAKEDLTGGQIKNVLLGAARKAVSANSKDVKKEHFLAAIKQLKANTGKMGGENRAMPMAKLVKAGGSLSKVRAEGKDIIKVINP